MRENCFFERLIRTIEKILEYIVVLLFVIVVLSSLIQVVSRTIFGRPILWCEETARFAGIWMIMLAMGIIFKERGHIGVDFFYNKMPKKVQGVLDYVNDFFTTAVMTLFTIYSAQLLVKGYSTPSPSLRIPMGVIYIGVVLGSALSVLFCIYAIIKTIYRRRDGKLAGDGTELAAKEENA